jgi:hypothetical protein
VAEKRRKTATNKQQQEAVPPGKTSGYSQFESGAALCQNQAAAVQAVARSKLKAQTQLQSYYSH